MELPPLLIRVCGIEQGDELWLAPHATANPAYSQLFRRTRSDSGAPLWIPSAVFLACPQKTVPPMWRLGKKPVAFISPMWVSLPRAAPCPSGQTTHGGSTARYEGVEPAKPAEDTAVSDTASRYYEMSQGTLPRVAGGRSILPLTQCPMGIENVRRQPYAVPRRAHPCVSQTHGGPKLDPYCRLGHFDATPPS